MRTLRLVALAVAFAIVAGPAAADRADAAKARGARHTATRATAIGCDTQRHATRTTRSPRSRRARAGRCATDRQHRKVLSMPASWARGARPAASAVSAPAATVAGVPDAPAGPVAAGPLPPPPPPAPVVSTLGVGAWDVGGFVLRLTRTSVAAGVLTVFFRNNDVSDHNLWIESPGGDVERISDTVGEGGGAARTLAVTAGAWRLFCSLPDHGAMTRTLTVTP